jgi:hypothetical protein
MINNSDLLARRNSAIPVVWAMPHQFTLHVR